MNYLALLILDDPSRLEEVLNAWTEGGIQGATILESTGLFRQQSIPIPWRYRYANQQTGEWDNVTLLALVPDAQTAQKCLTLAEGVVGDLDEPNTGVFAAWPVEMVKGNGRLYAGKGDE